MQLLDQEEFKKLFNGYYHDENFNEEMNKEKLKIIGQPTRQQTRSHGNQKTDGQHRGGGARNDSSMESSSHTDQQSKFTNYQKGSGMLASSKRTDLTNSQPQSQEQPPRAKKYR